MPFANTAILDLLKLLLNNTTWAGVGDATGIVGSTAAGSWFLSLHTSSPGAGGDQTTNEIAYTGYARVAVARTSGGWTVSANPGLRSPSMEAPGYSAARAASEACRRSRWPTSAARSIARGRFSRFSSYRGPS